jgi:tetratricopeptide (TPR) repeat protein
MQAGRFDAAEPLVMESIPIRDGEPLADDAAHGRRLNLLGVIREMLGRPDDALWAFARAERVFLSALGSEHADTTRARANMARIYAGLGRAAEAEPLLADVVPRLEAANTEDELAVALNAFGLVRQAQTRHGEALTYFERALAIFEKQHGPEFRDCADVLQNLAWSVEFLGDAKRARQARARAEKIRRA